MKRESWEGDRHWHPGQQELKGGMRRVSTFTPTLFISDNANNARKKKLKSQLFFHTFSLSPPPPPCLSFFLSFSCVSLSNPPQEIPHNTSKISHYLVPLSTTCDTLKMARLVTGIIPVCKCLNVLVIYFSRGDRYDDPSPLVLGHSESVTQYTERIGLRAKC